MVVIPIGGKEAFPLTPSTCNKLQIFDSGIDIQLHTHGLRFTCEW
jgi:hypothetical protein